MVIFFYEQHLEATSWLNNERQFASTTTTMSSQDTPPNEAVDELPFIVEPPFDDPKADAILHTSDGAQFYVHKLLLSLTSPVFETMFTLPQPGHNKAVSGEPGEPGVRDSKDFDPEGRCIVRVDESSYAMHRTLTCCDPRCIPIWKTLEDIQAVLQVADKYDMSSVRGLAGEALKQFVVTEPLRVFAIASRYGLDDTVTAAARETLRFTFEECAHSNIPELGLIPAFALQNLHKYRIACGRAAKRVAEDFSWVKAYGFVWQWVETGDYYGNNHSCVGAAIHEVYWAKWWTDYMVLAATALYKTPRGSTVINPVFSQKTV